MRPDAGPASDARNPVQALLLVPVLALLPAVVGGVVRTTTGLSLGPALALGALVTALAAWWGRSAFGRSSSTWWTLGAAALAAVAAVYALEVRAFEGLPSVGGGDAGNHVGNARWFDAHAPRAYLQFVGFYALVGLVRRLTGSGSLEAFRICWDLLLACLAWLAFTIAWVAAPPGRPVVRAGVAFGVSLAVAGVTWIPLVGYEQADGFYSQLAGLTVVTVALACVSMPESRAWRLLALLAAPVVLRFTYGLNLADVLAAVALLLWSEHHGLVTPRLRPVLRVLALCCLVAAAAAGHALWPLRLVEGALVRPAHFAFLGALGCLVASLLWALRASPAGVEGRMLRACLALTGTTTVIQWVLAALGDAEGYYPAKHGAQALLLGSLGVGAVLAGAGRRARGAVVLGLAGLLLARVSVQPWWMAYRERLRGTPTWRSLQPLYDPDARARIRGVLRAESRAFGGYLDPSWPLMNAMNADLGFPGDWTVWDVGLRQFDDGRTIQGADTCVFWSDAPGDQEAYQRLAGGFGRGTARSWARLRALGDQRCAEYPARWDRRALRRLCWHCGGPGD